MLSHYLAAIVALSATTVLSGPSRINEARDVQSNLESRNFYWQCAQGKSFVGNAPPDANPGSCTSCQPGTFSPDGVNCYTTPMGFYNDKKKAFNPIGCAAGFYTDTTGAVICKACPATQISYAAATKCMVCADGSTSLDGQYCTPCDVGYTSTGGAACTSTTLYSIVITDSANTKLGFLSNVGEISGFDNVGGASNALKVNAPAFNLGTSPQNLIATTLGTDTDGSTGPGYALSMVVMGKSSLYCDGSNKYGLGLTQSATDNKVETFNLPDPQYIGHLAASKIWVIGAFDSVNQRWPITMSILGTPAATVPITTSLYFFGTGTASNTIYASCDPKFQENYYSNGAQKYVSSFFIVPVDLTRDFTDSLVCIQNLVTLPHPCLKGIFPLNSGD